MEAAILWLFKLLALILGAIMALVGLIALVALVLWSARMVLKLIRRNPVA